MSTCYQNDSQQYRATIWKLEQSSSNIHSSIPYFLQKISEIPGNDCHKVLWNQLHTYRFSVIFNNKIEIYSVNGDGLLNKEQEIYSIGDEFLFKTGCWSIHYGATSLYAISSNSVVSLWDIRSKKKSIEFNTAGKFDSTTNMDTNPINPHYLVTSSNNGSIKFWDTRNYTIPIHSHYVHSHCVWSVKYDNCFDQLVTTASSDSTAKLLLINSHKSNNEHFFSTNISITESDRNISIIDTNDLHEDSVYDSIFSTADAFCYASLSFNGRFFLCSINDNIKYNLIVDN